MAYNNLMIGIATEIEFFITWFNTMFGFGTVAFNPEALLYRALNILLL